MGEIAKTKKVIHHIECRRCSLYWTIPLKLLERKFEFWDSVLRFYVLKSLKYSILNYSDAFEIFMEIFGSESIFWYLMWEFACNMHAYQTSKCVQCLTVESIKEATVHTEISEHFVDKVIEVAWLPCVSKWFVYWYFGIFPLRCYNST